MMCSSREPCESRQSDDPLRAASSFLPAITDSLVSLKARREVWSHLGRVVKAALCSAEGRFQRPPWFERVARSGPRWIPAVLSIQNIYFGVLEPAFLTLIS